MDRFRIAFLATAPVFFWGILFLGLMVSGVAGYSSFAFAMIPLGLISLAGCIRVVICLKDHSPYWMFGIALAVVIAAGILTAFVYLLISAINCCVPGDPLITGIQLLGAGFLMALAPCSILLLISCSPLIEDCIVSGVFIAITFLISLLPLMLLGDLLFATIHITTTAYFVHPWWEGLMMLYGMAGSPFIGALLMLTAIRLPEGYCQ